LEGVSLRRLQCCSQQCCMPKRATEGKIVVSENVNNVDDVTAGAVSAQGEESTEDFILKRLKRGQTPTHSSIL
jgi:hypothetical protein